MIITFITSVIAMDHRPVTSSFVSATFITLVSYNRELNDLLRVSL